MTHATQRATRFFCLGTALLVAGCTTPPAVYELAEKSAGNAGVFQGHLAELSAQSRSQGKARAENIANMDLFNAQFEGWLARELYMQQQSRPAADWAEMKTLMDRLTALRDGILKIEKDNTFKAADRKKELLSGQVELNAHRAAMRATAEALGALGKEESSKERVKFFAAFAREVRTEMNKSLESGEETTAGAKKIADRIKEQFKKADPTDEGAPKAKE
jgi:hypothetical protein